MKRKKVDCYLFPASGSVVPASQGPRLESGCTHSLNSQEDCFLSLATGEKLG